MHDYSFPSRRAMMPLIWCRCVPRSRAGKGSTNYIFVGEASIRCRHGAKRALCSLDCVDVGDMATLRSGNTPPRWMFPPSARSHLLLRVPYVGADGHLMVMKCASPTKMDISAPPRTASAAAAPPPPPHPAAPTPHPNPGPRGQRPAECGPLQAIYDALESSRRGGSGGAIKRFGPITRNLRFCAPTHEFLTAASWTSPSRGAWRRARRGSSTELRRAPAPSAPPRAGTTPPAPHNFLNNQDRAPCARGRVGQLT